MAIRRRRGFALGAVGPAILWSLLAAGAGSVAEPTGYWLGDANAPVPATLQGGTVIHVKGIDALVKKGATAVDVSNAPRRPDELAPGAPWMPLPHRTLPHALWIPGAGAGRVAPEVDELFRSRLAQATAGRFDAPLVIYCHERCWLSWNAAKRAMGYGYRRVYWFADGIEGWTAAGRPTAVADPQLPSVTRTVPAVQLPKLVVLDIELSGDLGGPEFAAEHDARLKTETARLRQDLERTELYQVLNNGAAQATIDRLKSQQAFLHDCNGCDLDVGRQLNADLVFVAWVNRVSGLILTLTYEIHDVKSGQIAARKSYDFRGDNDAAWNHAIDYMVRDLKSTAR